MFNGARHQTPAPSRATNLDLWDKSDDLHVGMLFLIARRTSSVRRPRAGAIIPALQSAPMSGVRACLFRQATAVVPILVAILILLGSIAVTQTAVAQEEPNFVSLLEGPDRSTPQAWIASFISEAASLEELLAAYSANKTWTKLQAYSSQLEKLRGFFDLDAVSASYRRTVGTEAVVQMIDILNRLPASQVLANDAQDAVGVSANGVWTLPGTGLVLIRRQEGGDAGKYVMPREVVEQLPSLREKVMSLPLVRETAFRDMRSAQANQTGPHFPRRVATAFSGWLDAPHLGVPSWKLLVAFVALIATIAANIIVYCFVRATSQFRSRDVVAWLGLLGPITLAASFVAFGAFCQTELILQGDAELLAVGLRDFILLVSAAWAILSFADIVSEMLIGRELGPDKQMDADLTRFIGRILGTAGALAVFLYGLGTLGVPTAGIITSLGVGGISIALAVRVTMENLFGGLVLLLDRTFRIGDHIKTKDGEGTVTSIGVRSCRIKTFDGNTLTIPNGALSASAITKVQPHDAVHPDILPE
ncbi:mechanosensitive ion channel family protein [Tabrizicola sp. J26]|uniref:mechanosensitive ion channel family protein n=1 Tax=Alitabrizicola rongguiensis TaxID=2909234 RepID=UPI001F473460|nr:mechanosensitive ion channel domain-containing protein [Tabrizicola rongguiensis]MCF1709459.1 mechanosensitive ion channel family protein [Tabrizicola rongguiensis]